MKMFYEHTFLREACYVCPYKNLQRISDISIADAWGVRAQMHPNGGHDLSLDAPHWVVEKIQENLL